MGRALAWHVEARGLATAAEQSVGGEQLACSLCGRGRCGICGGVCPIMCAKGYVQGCAYTARACVLCVCVLSAECPHLSLLCGPEERRGRVVEDDVHVVTDLRAEDLLEPRLQKQRACAVRASTHTHTRVLVSRLQRCSDALFSRRAL